MKKPTFREKLEIINFMLTDPELLNESKIILTYCLLNNMYGLIEDNWLKENFRLSDYKVKKVKQQLKELNLLKLEDL